MAPKRKGTECNPKSKSIGQCASGELLSSLAAPLQTPSGSCSPINIRPPLRTPAALPLKLVIADDHHIIRHALKLFLESDSDLKVTGEASNGIETLEAVERLKPDLLIIDLFMPVLNGLEVLQQLKKKRLRTKIIILSMHADEAYVLQALQSGASAYVLKQSTANNLVQAIREVSAGRRYLSPPLSERAIEFYVGKLSDPKALPKSALTIRESEILALITDGLTNAAIASRLSISPRTVEHHRASVMRKLKCRSQADLIRQALLYLAPKTEPVPNFLPAPTART